MRKTRDLFKKRYQENISCKDGSDKDLTEIEEIKKRQQEYTEELYKKDPNDPDDHDGMLIHTEPDILENEVGLRKHYC